MKERYFGLLLLKKNWTIYYLEVNWNTTVSNKFKNEFHRTISLILANPYQFPRINNERNYHKCVITKHNSIFYRIIDEKTIRILHIFDNRQHPDR